MTITLPSTPIQAAECSTLVITIYHYCNLDLIVWTPPPPFLLGVVEPPTKFSKRGGGLAGSQFLEGVVGKEGVTSFRGVQFLHKQKLRSDKFNNTKKFISKDVFLCHN